VSIPSAVTALLLLHPFSHNILPIHNNHAFYFALPHGHGSGREEKEEKEEKEAKEKGKEK